ncbi:MAG: hypothetical protein M3373_02795, partial [Gemmatimonadota bacterium]|nr:hypothetical protein [Gemmatimonadota bacterium]
MGRTAHSRKGFALTVAIVAIVVIGTMIAGIFFASMQQGRRARNHRLQASAMAAAEFGMNRTVSTDWKGSTWNTMPIGRVDSTSNAFTSHGASSRVRVTRIGNANVPLFLVASEGSAGTMLGAQARRRTSTVVALQLFNINILGALTTRGATKIGGSSYINGHDTPYSGWSCPAAGTSLPGIATGDSSQIQTSGCNNFDCVDGTPKVQQNAVAADTSTYFDFGNGVTWDDLTAMAKIVTAGPTGPVVIGGVCQTSPVGNWGDPNRSTPQGECENYFPILYAPGDLHVTGGSGQGILLVEGNFHVTGGFQFFGPVVVRGDLDTQGTGGHFNGGVMAANVNLAQNTVLGNAVISYSSCILSK